MRSVAVLSVLLAPIFASATTDCALKRKILVGGFPDANKTDGNYAVLEFDDTVKPNKLSVLGWYNTTDGQQKAWMSRHATRPDLILASNDAGGPGLVSSYALDAKTGQLSFLDSASSGGIPVKPESGVAACYTSSFPDGKVVDVANYFGATASTYRFDAKTGKFGERINKDLLSYPGYKPKPGQQETQDFSHPHQIVAHPRLPFVYVIDHGEDLVKVYKRDSSGKLSKVVFIKQRTGSAPRHLSFSPDGHFLYLLHEASVNVTPYKVLPTGHLVLIQAPQTIYPKGTKIDYPSISGAEVYTSKDGKFLYASGRNATAKADIKSGDPGDTVVVWSISPLTGRLKRVQTAQIKTARQLRSFELSTSGSMNGEATADEYMVIGGQLTQNALVYRCDKRTGKLSFAAEVALPSFSPSTFVWV